MSRVRRGGSAILEQRSRARGVRVESAHGPHVAGEVIGMPRFLCRICSFATPMSCYVSNVLPTYLLHGGRTGRSLADRMHGIRARISAPTLLRIAMRRRQEMREPEEVVAMLRLHRLG